MSLSIYFSYFSTAWPGIKAFRFWIFISLWVFLCHIKLILNKFVCFPPINLFHQLNSQTPGKTLKEGRGKVFPTLLVTYILVGIKYTNSQSYLVLVLPQQQQRPTLTLSVILNFIFLPGKIPCLHLPSQPVLWLSLSSHLVSSMSLQAWAWVPRLPGRERHVRFM